jgi:type VI secretion system protein ImpJ
MSLNNKVVWSEGMFLNPQHFQQQERYFEALVEAKFSALGAYRWGIHDLDIDQQLLSLGKVSIVKGRGIFPDGTPFEFPSVDEPPAVMELTANTKNEIIYLCLPVRRAGARDVATSDSSQGLARFVSQEQEIRDVTSDSSETIRIDVGRPNLKLIAESEDRSGYISIGLMRVVEVREDNKIIGDETYIPGCLDCTASPRLAGYFSEIISLLHSRGEAIAGRLADANRGGTAEVADYMLLQLINRLEPAFRHMAHIEGIHPADMYAHIVQMVGELSTFGGGSKRTPVFPGYKHDDLNATFDPAITALRNCFSTVHEQSAISLQLIEKKYGIRVAEIADRSLIGSAIFVLAAKADLPEESIRNHLPAQLRIGPVERIRQLVNAALPGIAMKPMPVAPRQIPFHSGYSYFQLEPHSEFWNELKHSGGFAIHVGGDFPGLSLEFWAIRQ